MIREHCVNNMQGIYSHGPSSPFGGGLYPCILPSMQFGTQDNTKRFGYPPDFSENERFTFENAIWSCISVHWAYELCIMHYAKISPQTKLVSPKSYALLQLCTTTLCVMRKSTVVASILWLFFLQKWDCMMGHRIMNTTNPRTFEHPGSLRSTYVVITACQKTGVERWTLNITTHV
jgi:hypothetical protein